MRVEEQADPIDRSSAPPSAGRIDVAGARARAAWPELAGAAVSRAARGPILYADAEKAFGKDKAKKGYKADAERRVFGSDASALAGAGAWRGGFPRA